MAIKTRSTSGSGRPARRSSSRSSPDEAVVSLRGVSTAYEGERTPTLNQIDLEMGKGEFVAVIGPNGAGKTTLLETVLGLLQVMTGKGAVLGLDLVRDRYSIRRRTAYVIQNFDPDPLAPFLCGDVVMTGRTGRIGLLRYPTDVDRKAVGRAVDRLGIGHLMDRPAGRISGGEFQKVLLARALAVEPDLYLLDEPFSNLDPAVKGDVAEVISEENRGGRTVLMVSHGVSEIPGVCDRLLLMDRGRIVIDGTRDEVITFSDRNGIFRGCCR